MKKISIKKLQTRLELAIKNCFWLETIVIEYGIIDDICNSIISATHSIKTKCNKKFKVME